MPLRSSVYRWSWLLAIVTAAVAAPTTPSAAPSGQKPPEQKKPSISLRANPTAGFSPLRVVVTAEVTGAFTAETGRPIRIPAPFVDTLSAIVVPDGAVKPRAPAS